MAGGPPRQNPELKKLQIEVTGGGVHTGALIEDNNFEGQFTNRVNYTGPPARPGLGPVVPRERNVDGTITIRNDGSFSQQPILARNSFGNDVHFEQNINIQAPGQYEGREELMDLR